jgi:hypothetical protein
LEESKNSENEPMAPNLPMPQLQNRNLLILPQSRSPEYILNAASAFLKYEGKIDVKEEHMDHRRASHFVPKNNNTQGVSNAHGTSTEAHSAKHF